MEKYMELTVEQAQLLQRIANEKGRFWKREVSSAWEKGNLNGRPIPGHLQRLRNTHGPQWLYHHCKIKPVFEPRKEAH